MIWGGVTRKPKALVHGQWIRVPPIPDLMLEQPRRDEAAAATALQVD